MLRSGATAHGLLAGSRPKLFRPAIGRHLCRPARQPRLGATAFKDWFTGFVQPKEVQPQQPSQAASHDQPSAAATATAVAPPPAAAAPKRDFLEARQVSLFQLFDSSDYKFDIPAYQRPYAWQTKQIYELLQDFVKAYQSRQEYFLGAIVATKATDGTHMPYQLIDGQQRLTSMVILLAFLHGWAREQGNEVLEGRIRRMLYLDADPLEPDSKGRYRLRLRDADDGFFRTNMLDSFLPTQYRLTGVAAAAAGATATSDVGETAEGSDEVPPELAPGAPGAAAALFPGAAALPLENETWWRLYENAAFLRSQLNQLVAEGLNLQDFTFHVLRNCFVVMMVARDEGASFRIFSTLNGRGMDLSVVDKLKADLLAGELSPVERAHYADAWAEMESVLGRAAFHRVFDYMRDLATVKDPRVANVSVLDYFTRRVDDPRAVKQVLQVSLDYARLLLQLRQASWVCPELAAVLAETTLEPQDQEQGPLDPAEQAARAASVAAAIQVLEQTPHSEVLAPEEEGRHLEALHAQHRTWQQEDGVAGAGVGAAALVAAPVENPEQEELEVTAAAVSAVEGEQAETSADGEAADLAPIAVLERAEEEDGMLVFRFDSQTPPAATATSIITDDAEATATPAVAEVAIPTLAETGVTATTAASAGLTLEEATWVSQSGEPAEASVPAQLLPPEALAWAEEAAAAPEQQQQQPAEVPQAGAQDLAVSEQVLAVGELESIPQAQEELQAEPLAELQEPLQQQQEEASEQQRKEVVVSRAELQQLVEAASTALLAAGDGAAQAAEVAEEVIAVTAGHPVTETVEAAEAALASAAAAAAAAELLVSERQRQAALLAELDVRSRHLNMFSDEAWLPPLLEFFYQTESLEHRVAFMKGAEALQLLLELQADPAAKAARWRTVSEALLQRPFRPESVLEALNLRNDEREAFRARLDSKDLYGTADQRTLRHLLVRCEPPEVAQQLSGLGSLLVEKIVPQSPPEGSQWRKTRITSVCDPESAWPETWYASAPTAAAPVPSSEASAAAPEDGSTATVIVVDAAAPAARYEVKYWYEVQRLNWHGKLGNLVLLPATAASASAATADYDAKAAMWRQAGVLERLPGFTAPLVEQAGRYSRFKFCYEECRQRHEDMLERLCAVFEL